MDNYKEVLEYLIVLKKTKKEPNKIERDQFTEAWQKLVSVEGYTDFADSCLYNGFTYCGASVVKNYIKNSDNPSDSLKKVFSGSMYGKNCANTVPILFHLLTLLLNEKHPDTPLIAEIIKRIPSALKNKEGKIYGQADRALKKYILDDLHSESLPSFATLIDSGLKPLFVKEFIVSFDEIFFGMKTDGFSKKCLKNIKLLTEWMHPVQEVNAESEESNPVDITTDKSQQGDALTEIVASGNAETVENEQLISCEKELQETKKTLAEAAKEVEFQKTQVAQLRQQLSELNADRARLNELANTRESKIITLSGEISAGKRKLDLLQAQVDRLERESRERAQMMEALSRDRARQSDEAFNRLASKLRIEYRDFMDAVDIPMDSDLGENMREQLKNVFDILVKAGIAIS